MQQYELLLKQSLA